VFRDDHPLCLQCKDAALDKRGARWLCTACGSSLVPANELQDALNEVSPDDWRELEQRLCPSPRLAKRKLMCPLCKTLMESYAIIDVEIEVCAAHGAWLHRNDEMRMVLRNEAMFTARNSRTPRGALVPLGIGIIFGALLSPWLDKRRLRKDIERTSPPPKPKSK